MAVHPATRIGQANDGKGEEEGRWEERAGYVLCTCGLGCFSFTIFLYFLFVLSRVEIDKIGMVIKKEHPFECRVRPRWFSESRLAAGKQVVMGVAESQTSLVAGIRMMRN